MLTRSQFPNLLFDPEVEKTARRLRKQAQNQRMARQEEEAIVDPIAPVERSMFEYSRPTSRGFEGSISRPSVAANNFEIKPALISMIQNSVQFGGLPSEDPNQHLVMFLQLCDTVKYNGVTEDAIRLRLFPFSLRDRASQWLSSLARGSITTWDQLEQVFLDKFYPPSKTANIRTQITSFTQRDS